MDGDYMSRGYLLPQGCKDLIDVIAPKVTVTDRGLTITVQLPDLRHDQIEVTFEGRQLRISRRQSEGKGAVESVTEVPSGFDLSQARAAYFAGQLRIVVPRGWKYCEPS